MFLIPNFIEKKADKFPANNKPQIKTTVKPHTILLDQKTNGRSVFILHEGMLKSYYPYDNHFFYGLTYDQYGYFGFEGYFEREGSVPTILTQTTAVISIYPVSDLMSLFKKNPDTYIAYLSYLNHQVTEMTLLTNQITKELNNLRLFNIQVAHMMKFSGMISTVSNFQDILHENPLDANEVMTLEFLNNNLGTYFKYDSANPRDNNLAIELVHGSVVNDFIPVLKKKINITKLINKILFKDLENIQEKLTDRFEILTKEMNCLLFDKNSFIKEVQEQFEKIKSKEWKQAFKDCYDLIQEKVIENIFIKRYFEMEDIMEFIESVQFNSRENDNSSKQEKDEETKEEKASSKVNEKNARAVMLEQMKVDAKSTEITLSEIQFIKDIQDKNEMSRDEKLRIRSINKKFIDNLTTAAIKKYITDEKLSPAEELLISTGVVSKALVEQEQLNFIIAKMKTFLSTKHVMTLEKWISQIANTDIVPSNDELGTTYRKYLLELKREEEQKKIEYVPLTPKELMIQKVTFEIHHAVEANIRIANRNKKAVYGINSTTFPLHPEQSFVQADDLKRLLHEIIAIDPTLFFREALYTFENGDKKSIDFEVLPIFIILPTIGERIIFWQEYSPNNKRSAARFFVPMFFTEDLRKAFIEAIATFRWELCRATKGFYWRDPIEGGITGAYNDYINFYKRNIALSTTAKEKVEKLIRDHRKNQRSMFCQNYYEWIENERTGSIRFSPYLRMLFFKYIPFGREIREELKSTPSFSNLIRIYEARRKKELNILSKQYKKFMDENGKLPLALENHIKSYNR